MDQTLQLKSRGCQTELSLKKKQKQPYVVSKKHTLKILIARKQKDGWCKKFVYHENTNEKKLMWYFNIRQSQP